MPPQPRPRPKREKKLKPVLRIEQREKKEALRYKRWLIIAAISITLLIILLRMGKEEAPEGTVPGVPEQAAIPPEGSVHSGTGWKPLMTGETPVPPASKNTLPEVVSIKLSPKLVYPGTRIKAVIEGRDADGDPVTFYREWKKNDATLEGETTDELDTKGFKKGDMITLYVAPFDGKEKGKTKWSPTVMIQNRPPEITSSPPAVLSGEKYVYDVKAVDPDGDKLTFLLENAPPGMTIDPAKGRIDWTIPKAADVKPPATYKVKVAATDGNASAFQQFSLTPKIEIITPLP